MKLTVHPLTPERWDDLEALFGCCGTQRMGFEEVVRLRPA
jgi:hypothetical protein